MSSDAMASRFELKNSISDKRLIGMWRIMTGFRLSYLGATLSLGMSALARTASLLLLGYYVDRILSTEVGPRRLGLVALAFIGLASIQGAFTFLSGRLVALTAEGIVLRLRNYLFDHIQRLSFSYHDRTPTGDLIQRSTSDVDALRRSWRSAG